MRIKWFHHRDEDRAGQPVSAFDFAFQPDLSKLIMASIARNSPCPCGSGKKYKRCCIDKPQPTAAMIHRMFEEAAQRQDAEAKNAYKVFRKYPSTEVLKMLSLLQLQSGNHGKNVRLEAAVAETIRHMNLTATAPDLQAMI